MKEGDLCKYVATSTVGKVTEVRERDGRTWARLDRSDLWYDTAYLIPADPSEYREVSFKEREVDDGARAIEDLQREAAEADTGDIGATGGG